MKIYNIGHEYWNRQVETNYDILSDRPESWANLFKRR
jgi:hypothetical protein